MTPSQALLSQILQNNDIYYKANACQWWFTDPKDNAVFTAIQSALEEGLQANVATIGMKLMPDYVASLTSLPVTTANWKHYASQCKTQGATEEMRKLGLWIGDNIGHLKPSEIIETATDKMDSIVSGTDEYKIQAMKDLLIPMMEDLEKRYHNRGTMPGLQTGFETLDGFLCGFQKSRLYIIGARPSQGKSAIALNMAGFISAHEPVGFLSLESSWEEMLMREISSDSGINSQRLASGYFKNTDFDALTQSAERLFRKNLYIYDKPNCDLATVQGQCRRMVQRHKCKIIFIDYLQLIQAKGESDRERVSHVSKRLKDLARELKVPIVALAQLRRDSEGRRPTLADFQHSSQIEQDADGGLLLWHRVYDNDKGSYVPRSKPENDNEEVRIFLLVEKNRDGRTGDIQMEFMREIVKFKEIK